ncbi:Uma2 family endonuclease [Geitlerinema sp. PCC 9228]|uniref:Uma2 family endonuclease n=1 Tax=Geitlerinema sp. PCC 9228 TaxID=111611 RepID=UPI0008F9DEBB|nr:Uma2 family endonuclease [Geitlerinema sp. PCC 9228]
MAITSRQLSLQEFLQLPEIDESPAWELVDQVPRQKPMPTAYHSILQKRLVAAIDACDSPYEAFPKLRCMVEPHSIVSDIVVMRREQIPTGNSPFVGAPPWIVEILSPNQSTTKIIAKMHICLQAGSQLGWLIDPGEKIVIVMRSRFSEVGKGQNYFSVFQGEEVLPVLEGLDWEIMPVRMFGWLF